MDSEYAKARTSLIETIQSRALRYGNFTLASGAKSGYYLDVKQVLLFPPSLHKLGYLATECLRGQGYECIGGPEIGAIPLAAAVVLRDYEFNAVAREMFVVRKKPKEYGTGAVIEGRVFTGNRVVIVDDVATTGHSTLRAIAEVEKLGARVVKVICVVDRLQGAAEALKGYDYVPLFTVRDLGIKD